MDISNKKKYIMSIVLVGDFSPLMFEPLWFLNNRIITKEQFDSIERENKEKCLISSPITFFETGDFAFKVTDKRFSIVAKKEPFIALVDIFRKIYEVMSGLTIKRYGINYCFHLKCDDISQYKRFGDNIAPKNYWDPLFLNYENVKEREDSGLFSMQLSRRREYGSLNVCLESSSLLKPGIFLSFNFSYYDSEKKVYDFSDVIDVIEQNFSAHEKEVNLIATNLIKKAATNE